MRRRYVTADVFTDRMFGGNPLAVVLDAEGLSSEQMQAIALEFNYSETTFVLPPRDPKHTAQVRIFTPRVEMPFAGHPNVGTAFLLARDPAYRTAAASGGFVFEEAAGLVPMRLMREGDAVIATELKAPKPLARLASAPAEATAACLSLEAADIDVSVHNPEVASVGMPFLMVALHSREALSRAKPDLTAFGKLLPLDGADAVFFYWRQPTAAGEAVLHARMFAPFDGVMEDPATGSAGAAVIALLASLDKAHDAKDWRIHQGDDMGRPSVLLGRTRRHAQGTDTFIGGRCVAVLEGSLIVPDNF
jgi:trans-2,3-dihydro-3-hydroxyanthranilate isomerase